MNMRGLLLATTAALAIGILPASAQVLGGQVSSAAVAAAPISAHPPDAVAAQPAAPGTLSGTVVDVDANPGTPAKYGIRGIPTLILFKGGQVAAQKVGALSKSQLTAFLDSQL